MSLNRVGYQTPSGMAGIMSPGKVSIGGIRIPPKLVIYATVALIFVILVARIVLKTV